MATKGMRHRYPREYNSWRNMKSRSKEEGKPVHPQFERFSDFLAHMGECPRVGFTLDRIDPRGAYEPANCRWADKRMQSNNRKNTVYMEYQGRRLPVGEVSRLTGIKADTLRRKVKKGSEESSASGEPPDPLQQWRWMGDDEEIVFWRWLYHAREIHPEYEIGVAHKDEPFEAFIYRFAHLLLKMTDEAAAVDNELPAFVRQRVLDRAVPLPDQRTRYLRLIERLSHSAFNRVFADDPLVDGNSCDVRWIDPNAKDLLPAIRSAVRSFDQAGVPLPPLLAQLYEKHKAALMLTRRR